MSRILIHSIVFSPDGVSTAYLYNDIAVKFKNSGHDVVVLTTTPHYNVVKSDIDKQPLARKFFGLYWESEYHGIRVKHIPQKKFKASIFRIIGFIYWHIASLVLGLFERKVDVIISPSPPLSIGIVNIILAKLKSAKVIYNVQEIYPDLLIESGGLKSKYIIDALKYLEKFVYKYSDKVTTIDKVFYNSIIDRFNDKSKLHIIPNFVDTDIYKPIEVSDNNINREYFPDSKSLKLMYAGNIGHAQDWEPVLGMAKQLREESIEIFIIGEGVMKEYIENEVRINNLNKVHIIPYQNRESMPALIAYSDLQFIFMSPQTEGHGFPSKIYTIMACAKPMLVCSGLDTPIVNFLTGKNCAFLIKERQLDLKVNKIVKILTSVEMKTLKEMGSRGMAEIQLKYSKEFITDKYVELINSIT